MAQLTCATAAVEDCLSFLLARISGRHLVCLVREGADRERIGERSPRMDGGQRDHRRTRSDDFGLSVSRNSLFVRGTVR
jgi:hypothetical protein